VSTKQLLLLFLLLFALFIVISVVLAVIGAVFHLGTVVAIIDGLVAVLLFLSPGIYQRRRKRSHRQ